VRAIGSRIALFFFVLGLAGNAMAQAPSIQYAEPIALALKAGAAQFDAYGRRFSVTLTDNDRVLGKLSAQRKSELTRYRLLRGSLDGVPGSWVRLTEFSGGVEGAIWDGYDLYTVTRYERIAPYLTSGLDVSPGQTVVYRLSDSRDVLPRDYCALAGDTAGDARSKVANGLDQYQAVVHGLEVGLILPSITRQIEISLIADGDFQAAESADPTGAMLARLNIVEGIFSEQIGLLVLATDVRLIPAGSDPFTSTKGATLLEQLGTYRSATPAVRARGLAHLMTGKDLDGTTAGIAYVGTVCDVERGASLSSRSFGTTISALIMAHEIGHNLGAEHDGEPGTSCASVGGGFIMAPSVSGYTTFSQCSIDTMRPVIAAASCITAAEYADVSLDTDLTPVAGEGGVPFTLPFQVHSSGNIAADDAVLTVTLPDNGALAATLAIDSASSTLGSCSVSGSVATCTLGSMAAGTSAQVNVVAHGNSAATFSALVQVTASNDRLTSNNNRQMAVSIRSGVDAAVVLSTNAAEFAPGAPIEVYADVSSLRAMAVRNAILSLNLNQAVVSASIPGGVCTANASSVTCTLSELPSGTTRRLTVLATAQAAGPLFAAANVSVAGDGDFTNNNASTTAWVQAERDVELTAGAAGVDLGVGTVYEVPYTVRSRGPQPTGDVTLTISIPSTALVVDSIDAGGAACTQPDAITWRCALGSLAPGATRAVRLRVHAARPATADINAVAAAANDGYLGNNSAALQLRVDHLVDVQVVMGSGGSGVEGAAFDGQVALRSNGRQAASGAMLEINLHVAGTLSSATIHNGRACTLISTQRARCALPNMARNSQLFVDYTAEFADAGSYEIAFTVSAPGDTAPDNDVLTRVVLVRPYNDIAVSGSLEMAGLFGGQTRAKTFTVNTDRRALANARFIAKNAQGLTVQSITASVGDCHVDPDAGGICDFVDLPAFTTLTVDVTYLAAEGSWVLDPVVSVSTAGDVVSTNNSLTARVETHGTTDVELRVGTVVGGPRSTTLSFPLISLVNGAEKAFGTRLEVTLPAQVTVVSVSASNATCSGTSVLRCDFTDLDAGSTATVALSVRASADGSFVSSLKLSATNDNNAANDMRDVAVEISGGDAPPVSGGKGGGRIEFWMLGLLALLAAKRCAARRTGVSG
jgi:hypothetical protein